MRDYLRAAFAVLPGSARRRLVVVVALLVAISVLDLVALLLVLGVTTLGTGQGPAGEGSITGLPDWLEAPLTAAGVTSPPTVVSVLGLAVVAMFVAKAVLASVVLRRVLHSLAHREAQLTHHLMAQLMRAPLTFHLRRRHLDVMADITVGAEALIMKAVAPTILVVAELVLIVMLVGGLLVLAPLVALGSVVYFTATLLLLNRWIAKRATAAGQVDMETTRSGMITIQWALGGYREVVTRGVSGHYVDAVRDIRERGAASRAEVAYLGLLPRYFLESALVVGMAFAFAIQLPVSGFEGAVSGLALFAVAGFRLLPSLQRLQGSVSTIRAGRPFGERALRIQDELTTALAGTDGEPVTSGPASWPFTELRSGIELDGVWFTYPQASEPALRDVTLTIPARRMTALVGASGSGKSTLIDMLLALLPPSRGQIRIDGEPLQDVRYAWRSLIGYVPQAVFLMPASIRDNVALGMARELVDDEVVWEALHKASLNEVVRRLPGGLDFVLGDAGSGLSGGQRQRLGIARALYHRPQVLILDEATSALDVDTEAEITETLNQLAGLTKIVVAHRLSTVRHAEQVMFFREGRLVASGSFEQVSAAVPDFARQVELSGLAEARPGP